MIRRVEPDDWERLRDVRVRALTTDPAAFLETVDTARSFSDDRWRQRAIPSDRQVTFVHERDGSFDAMVSAFVDDEPETAHLVGMWVAPDLRGSGVANSLIDKVVEWSRARALARVALSVEGENTRAARLYETCGFVELDAPPPLPYEPPPSSRFYARAL